MEHTENPPVGYISKQCPNKLLVSLVNLEHETNSSLATTCKEIYFEIKYPD